MTIVDRRVLPFRPLPWTEPPDTLLGLLEAAEGLPDATVLRLLDAHFPEAAAFLRDDSAWNPSPQSDGFKLHAIPCGAVAGPDHGGLTAGEMPDDEMIDRAIALSRTGSRPRLDEIR